MMLHRALVLTAHETRSILLRPVKPAEVPASHSDLEIGGFVRCDEGTDFSPGPPEGFELAGAHRVARSRVRKSSADTSPVMRDASVPSA
jgi:hypothetical protein